MATATHPTAAPVARRALPAVAVVLGVAVLTKLVYGPWYLNYDARYALLWAGDVLEGRTPDYDAPFAPTPHPLSTAWSALSVPFGDGGDRLVVWLVLLAFGAVVWLAFRLGAELFSPAVGIVAAVTVLTRYALERDAVLGYQDVPFAALVLWAVLLEARRRRRGASVLAVLAVAGLLRPEAWALAGLYWLYLLPERSRSERARLSVLVAVGPVVWALMDYAVTGDALHSLHGTAALAETAERRRHLDQVPYWTAQYFGSTLREPLVLGVPLGLAFAWRHRRRAAALPLAVTGAMTLLFAVNPVFGLPLIGRYLRTPSVLLTLFYGLAVAGWLLLDRGHPERRRWLAVGAVALLASVAYVPWHLQSLTGLARRVDNHGGMYADLRAAARAAPVRAAFARCGPLAASDHRPVPYLRYWLHAAPGSVVTVEGGTAPLGRLLIVPRRTRLPRGFYRENLPRVAAPAGWRGIHVNRSWRVEAAPDCAPRRPPA